MRLRTLIPVGLLIGGMAIGFAVHGPLWKLFKHPDHHRNFVGKPPVDSPVAVRGGSVEGLGNNWTLVSNGIWKTTGVDVTTVTLDGVIPQGLTNPEQVTATPTADWSITLRFRKSDDSEDTTTTLQLCTNIQNGKCKNSGGTITNSNPLYLVDTTNYSNFQAESAPDDGRSLLTYTVPPCQDAHGNLTSHCSHIKKIHIDNNNLGAASLSFVDDDGDAVSGPFRCYSGACDIGFSQ